MYCKTSQDLVDIHGSPFDGQSHLENALVAKNFKKALNLCTHDSKHFCVLFLTRSQRLILRSVWSTCFGQLGIIFYHQSQLWNIMRWTLSHSQIPQCYFKFATLFIRNYTLLVSRLVVLVTPFTWNDGVVFPLTCMNFYLGLPFRLLFNMTLT